MKKYFAIILLLATSTINSQNYFSTTSNPLMTNSNISHMGAIALGINYEDINDPWRTKERLFEIFKPSGNINMKIGTNLGKLTIGVAAGYGNFSPIATPGDINFVKQGHNNVIFNLNNTANDGKHAFIFGDNMHTKTLTILNNGKVGVGTMTPDTELSVNGEIHAKKVRVDLIGWPDYVFKSSYYLPTLREVENFIKKHGHLKNIPNEKEVKENGVDVGDMTRKLLQKVEELTLYTIQQQKLIEELQKELKEVKEKTNK